MLFDELEKMIRGKHLLYQNKSYEIYENMNDKDISLLAKVIYIRHHSLSKQAQEKIGKLAFLYKDSYGLPEKLIFDLIKKTLKDKENKFIEKFTLKYKTLAKG